jgi:hypothetical protein
MIMKQLDPIEFGLKSIRVDEFATIQDTPIKKDKVKLGTGFGFGIDRGASEITVSLKVTFESENKPFVILQVSCTYMVKPEDFEKFPIKDESTIQIRQDFISHLAFLTVGTTRGVLYAKLEATSFKDYFLPIINVSNLAISDFNVTPSMAL